MDEKMILTQEGYDKIVAEHDELVSVRRKEVSERLKEAISYGDISENAEYDAAKNEQAELEERILKLENMMRTAEIVKEEEMSNDFVGVGSKVELLNMGTDKKESYVLVGTTETNPKEGKISNECPVGRNILGKKKGAVVEFEIPDGTVTYKIVSISR